LAIPIIPALVGLLLLLIFFPETPKALLIKNEECAAKEGKTYTNIILIVNILLNVYYY